MAASFESKTYQAEAPIGSACLVSGLNGNLEYFDITARSAAAAGYNTALYTYKDSVLLEGEPDAFTGLVDAIHADFGEFAGNNPGDQRQFVGFSLGGLIAYNLGNFSPENAQSMLIAGGVPLSHWLMHSWAARVFNYRRAFVRNGYEDPAQIAEALGAYEANGERPPQAGLGTYALAGTSDRIVNCHRAMETYREWARRGANIKVDPYDGGTHRSTIEFGRQNLAFLQARARIKKILEHS